jgi:4-hydroxythreonine-4-phosphate dehydrogenase
LKQAKIRFYEVLKMGNGLPVLAITMGDPSGIGPEITAKAFNEKSIYDICKPVVIGDASVMKQAIQIAKVPLKVRAIENVGQAEFVHGIMDVIDLKNVDISKLEYGKVQSMSGNAAFQAVKKAIELAINNEVDGTVTCPLNKESMNLAGYHYSGHTEIYAELTNTKDYTMMLADGPLRVVHVSTHVSLRKACDLVKKDRVLKVIKLAYEAMKSFGIEDPRIGVAGLNPHSGENGLFGWEEEREIIPAVLEAKKEGLKVEGPVAPDTLFSKAKGGQYDIVVAMYHDQGHIPLKVSGFIWNEEKKKWESVSGVNITLGLPVVRSSVDHGTAFGKAGKGTAAHESLMHAIEYGAKLASKKMS